MQTKRRSPVIGLVILILILALAAFFFHAVGGLNGLKVLIRARESLRRIDDQEIRAAFTELAEKNPEAEAYITGFTGVTDYNLDLDLSGELVPGEIPYLTQWDSRWGYCRYGSGLVGYTGCGPTALAMVAMGVTGDGSLHPAFMADFAIQNGYCVTGNGTAWTLFSEGAEKLGLAAKELPLWEDTMRAELAAGRPIICIMGPGDFTETGHYIVLTGCNPEGFDVYDPFRPSNCKVWDYDTLSPQIRNLWSYSV